MRNVAARLPRKIQAVCLAEAKTIYQARTRREAITRFRQWAADWRQTAPNAVKCIEDDLEELLPFLDCPQQHWKKVRTTNAIERSFREVRRRTRPSSDADDAPLPAVLGFLLQHLHKGVQGVHVTGCGEPGACLRSHRGQLELAAQLADPFLHSVRGDPAHAHRTPAASRRS